MNHPSRRGIFNKRDAWLLSHMGDESGFGLRMRDQQWSIQLPASAS
jgi:hypothetical protein